MFSQGGKAPPDPPKEKGPWAPDYLGGPGPPNKMGGPGPLCRKKIRAPGANSFFFRKRGALGPHIWGALGPATHTYLLKSSRWA